MTPLRHHDIHIEQLDDGTLRLTQVDYSGNDAIIDLHPDQLRSVAAQFASIQTTSTPADVVLRRFKAVVQAVRDAAWDESTFNDIWERAAEAQTLYTGLNAAMAMADEFIDDCETVIVTPVTRNAKADDSVTPARNSNALRQKRYRERQQEHRAKETAGTLQDQP